MVNQSQCNSGEPKSATIFLCLLLTINQSKFKTDVYSVIINNASELEALYDNNYACCSHSQWRRQKFTFEGEGATAQGFWRTKIPVGPSGIAPVEGLGTKSPVS